MKVLGKNGIRVALLLTVLPWLLMAGCKETFEPNQENHKYFFSIYGYLDASADTQWVRVMPVRDTLSFTPRPINIEVTLKNLQSGEATQMHDSLFTFAQGVHAFNFWTTMEIEPEQTYQLTAKHTDGPAHRRSYVNITLPPDFPTPVVQMATGSGNPDQVFIEGVERLADVQTVYHGVDSTSGEKLIKGIPQRQDTSRTVSNNFNILIDPRDHSSQLITFPPVFKRQIFVAAANPDFFDFGSIDQKVIALPKGISNIENGVGYLTGIVSKTIPYESCFDGNELVPCPLEPPPW